MDRDEAIDAAHSARADAFTTAYAMGKSREDAAKEGRAAFLASLDASGLAVVPVVPTVRMVEAGEDAMADIVKNPPALGVRCGCDDCDQKAWDAVKTVWDIMLSTARSEKEKAG